MLETKEFGYPRSQYAMEILQGLSKPEKYLRCISNDQQFADIIKQDSESFLKEKVGEYLREGKQ